MSENTRKNKEHWGLNAASYNTKFAKTIQQMIEEIQARKDWIGVDWVEETDSEDEDSTSKKEDSSKPKKTVKLLDYACGTGLVSRALAPHVTQTIGIDLTPAMVNEYNTLFHNQGIPASETHAVTGDLLDPSNPSPTHLQAPEFWNFDVAVVGLGFHHFDDPGLAAKRLSERLKKGGVFVIVDFLPHGGGHGHGHGHSHTHVHDHSSGEGEGKGKGKEAEEENATKKDHHAAAHTVTHLGFSEETVKRMFEEAGVGGAFEYVVLGKGIVFGEGKEKLQRSVFMARGTKL